MLADLRTLVNRDLPPVERACTSKVTYFGRREARAAAHGRHSDGQLRPYHCEFCGLWHLGHRRRHR